MSEEKRRVVIIGGGITGLTAAYYLQKHARSEAIPLDVKLVDASHRLGGKIQTLVRDGFVIERGPDSILTRKPSAARLAKEVGMEDKMVNNTAGKSYILARERLHPMPGGSIMGIPTEITPFLTTGLFSPAGKIRAAADFFLPRSNAAEDQSLGGFFRRRLGDEVVDNLIEPLLSGIYAGDIDQLSLMSTFPQFYQVEQKYRSIILGMKQTTPPRPHNPETKGKAKGMFFSFSTGLQSFIDAIEAKLEPNSVLKGIRVDRIFKGKYGYAIELNTGERLEADTAVVALPHQAIQTIFPQYEFFNDFKSMPSTSVATVALSFPESAIKKDIIGSGFVVSRNSDYTITACTWTHKKWAHSAPKGKALLRCYVGRAGDDTIVDLSDDQIVKIVLDDLNKTMSITEDPEFTVITRYKHAMPQYTVGHKQRIDTINHHVTEELPGVLLAGASFEGLGIPDCIDQGEKTVEKVLNYLQTNQVAKTAVKR